MSAVVKKKAEQRNEPVVEPVAKAPRDGPLVFISHDTNDADLAEAFGNLLLDASGGMLPSFRSSDKKGTAGIAYGKEWYQAVMSKLDQATDVVALLTPASVGRPWILYETGVAKGKLSTDVIGLALGMPLDKAIIGPFAQFQNLGDDEDSLTKLVLQLIKRNQQAAPRDEAVKRQVLAFREEIKKLIKERGATSAAESPKKSDDATIAKMFEEVKVLVRELPETFDMRVRDMRSPLRRMGREFHPMMFEEMMHHPALKQGSPGLGVVVFLSFFRDEAPWLYDLGLEYYRAVQSGDVNAVRRARKAFRVAVDFFSHGPSFFSPMDGPRDEERFHMLRHALRSVDHVLDRELRRRSADKSETPEASTK